MAYTTDSLSYAAAVEFLFGRINYEQLSRIPRTPNTFRLQRMVDLLGRIGSPHVGIKVIHIGGTKGKGSTATFVSSILQEAGFRTGLFTSPHLDRLEERFVLDGKPCTSDDLVQLVADIAPAVIEMDRLSDLGQIGGKPTFFEITTAMAFLYFARQQVDVAVVEVGLGGRLDSTNVCQPLVSVITSISFDHMRLLGNTLESIAREKAGIIKPATPVVCGVMEEGPQRVIRQVAELQGSLLLAAGEEFCFEYAPTVPAPSDAANANVLPRRPRMDYRWNFASDVVAKWEFRELELGLLGKHQAHNAALAITVAGLLKGQGWKISEESVRRGVQAAHCLTRVEVVPGDTLTVIDSAHNPASIDALIDTLGELAEGPWTTLVFATSGDKEAAKMLRRVLPCFEHVILTRFVNNPRGHDLAKLVQLARDICQRDEISAAVHEAADPAAAWDLAKQLAWGKGKLICITGSTFIAAEMRTLVIANKNRATS